MGLRVRHNVNLGEPARVSGSTWPLSALPAALQRCDCASSSPRSILGGRQPATPPPLAARRCPVGIRDGIRDGIGTCGTEQYSAGMYHAIPLPMRYAYPCLSERARLRFWSRHDASSECESCESCAVDGSPRLLSDSSQPDPGKQRQAAIQKPYRPTGRGPGVYTFEPAAIHSFNHTPSHSFTLPHPQLTSLHHPATLHNAPVPRSPFPLSAVL